MDIPMEMQSFDFFKGGIRETFKNCNIPTIYNICDTVEMLVDTGKSFSRFGDGEFKVMTNPDIDHNFQMNSERLRCRLKEIISSTDDEVEIGINRIYFYKDGSERQRIEDFLYKDDYANTILKYGHLGFLERDHYYDATFTIPYHHYDLPKWFFEAYFDEVKKIWDGKNIILVTGDSEVLDYEHNIFKERSKSVQLVRLSKKHAFEYQKRIMREVKKRIPTGSKSDYVVLFGCGIAATIFTYDFGKENICQAIDIGHLAKEYNNFKAGIEPWSKEGNFFSGTKTEDATRRDRDELVVESKESALTMMNGYANGRGTNDGDDWNIGEIPYFYGGTL